MNLRTVLCAVMPAVALAQVQTVNSLPFFPAAVATDASGYVYIAGSTQNPDLPALNSYKSRAVLSSVDLGSTWAAPGIFPQPTLAGIAADPRVAGTLLATTVDGIWKTTDAGVHWRRVLSLAVATGEIAYDPAVPGHVLTVGYGSADGGETWTSSRVLGATQWGPFAFDPRGNGVVFESGGAGYRSQDGGRTWTALPDSGPWHSFTFDTLRPGLVYGLGYTSEGLHISFDGGATFTSKVLPFRNLRWGDYAFGPVYLYADPGHAGRLYLITDAGVLYRSDDIAQTWQSVYSGVSGYSSRMLRACTALVFAGSPGYPASVRSLDDGNTWEPAGLPPGPAAAVDAGCVLYESGYYTQNGYVAKYSPDGQRLVWASYVSGSMPVSSVTSLAVTSDGSVAAGGTSLRAGITYASASKLDPAGNTIYSQTFGGGSDSVTGIAFDSTGAVWLGGTTASAKFPVTPDAFQGSLAGGTDAFLAKLDAAGELVYATYLGSQGDDAATSLAIDSKDRVCIGGYYSGKGSILLSRFDPAAGRWDRVAPSGDSASGGVDALAIGADDSIYATGVTTSLDFPATLPPFANSLNSSPSLSHPCRTPGDRFLWRLEADTMTPVYGRLFGAQCASSQGTGLQLLPDGTMLIASAPDDSFPQRASIAMQGSTQVAQVTADGAALLFSSPLPYRDVGFAVEPDGSFWAIANDSLTLARFTLPAPRALSLDHLGNAFSGAALGISTGIYTLTGTGLGPDTPIWLGFDAKDAPTALGGSRVWFNDVPAQLLYVSSNRLICLVPEALQGSVKVQVEYAGSKSNSIQGSVESGDAGLITTAFPATGSQAYAVNDDGVQNGPDNPAAAGSTVTFYGTGFPPSPSYLESPSPVWPPLVTCQTTVSQDSRFVPGLYQVQCKINLLTSLAGPVPLQMMRETPGFMTSRPVPVYFGNVVTIYVKSN